MGRWVCTMMEGSKGIRIRKGIMREINSGIIKIIRNLNRTSLAHFNESALAPTSLLNRWIHSFIELKVFGNQKHHYFDWFKKLINVNRLNIDSLVGSIIGDGDDWWLMNAFGSRYLFTLLALSLYKESHVSFKKSPIKIVHCLNVDQIADALFWYGVFWIRSYLYYMTDSLIWFIILTIEPIFKWFYSNYWRFMIWKMDQGQI